MHAVQYTQNFLERISKLKFEINVNMIKLYLHNMKTE